MGCAPMAGMERDLLPEIDTDATCTVTNTNDDKRPCKPDWVGASQKLGTCMSRRSLMEQEAAFSSAICGWGGVPGGQHGQVICYGLVAERFEAVN